MLIGVDAYQKDISPLYGTVNDAKALRDVLIKYAGFADERIVLMTTDSDDSDLIPTRGNIIDQLDKLQRVVPEDGLILFSFSGHGVSIGDDAFIVPSDGRIYQNIDLMRERAIDVLRIKRAIQATKVKQVIMFLDACRNDPVRAKGDVDNNLTTAYAKGFSFETKNQNIEAYATLYATSFGDRAYEFLDRKTNKYRGYFSYAIEEGLKGSAANDKGEVTLAGLIRYIEHAVKERVRINENKRQIPYPTTEGFRNSDLVIAVAERNTPITINPNSGEATFWSAIENSNDIEDFENYLSRITRGEFIGTYKPAAELKLNRLKKINFRSNWNGVKDIAKTFLKYSWVYPWSDNLNLIRIDGKYGFLDGRGRTVTEVKYSIIHKFSDGLALVRLNDKSGFVDESGKEVIPASYDNADSFSEGLAAVKSNGKWGFIDRSGKIIIPFQYEAVYSFTDGSAWVMTNKIWSGIDKSGKPAPPPIAPQNKFTYYEGLAVALGDNKCGYIDAKREWKIANKYDECAEFSEGVAAVKSKGKWELIDSNGKEIISLSLDYDYISKFKEGFSMVHLNMKRGIIDKSGKEIISPKKYDIWCLALRKSGFFGVVLNGKKGFVDIYGNEYFDF